MSRNMMRQFLKYALLAITFVAITTSGSAQNRKDFDLGRNMEIMINFMHAISTSYVDKVDAEKMMQNGAEGITSVLDPYTTFISEKEWAEFEVQTTGLYGGIGSLIRKKGDYAIIAEPYKGSPADENGLKIGDKIVAVNGVDIRGMSLDKVSSSLRGEPNTTVTITVERLLTGKRENIKIRRQRISIPSISFVGYIADGVGYIRHADFTEHCYDHMRAAIQCLQKAGELKSLVLDYRNNGGGLLSSAVDILSLFVPKGTMVVDIRGRDGVSQKLYTRHEPLLPNIPLAVLINGNSASAAEIVAGTIQDLDRGVLIGQRSFGKGLVQTTMPVGYNTYAKITTHKYYIPSGRCIQATSYTSEGRAKPLADSLIKEFKTVGGRKVYDGGGVMPDKKIEPKYINTFVAVVVLMGLVDDYGDEYMKKHHAKKIDVKTFSITDQDYEDFVKLAMERDIPYRSESRIALEKLQAALKKEQNNSLNEALEAIDKGIKDDKRSSLETFRKDIIKQINENIVLRYAYAEGVIANSLKEDEEVLAATKLLANMEEYKHIITKQDTERK